MKVTHTAFQLSTPEKADRFFGEFLGLKPVREYETTPELMVQIFGIEQGFKVRWYDIGGAILEIFMGQFEGKERPSGLNHICLAVPERGKFVKRAMEIGLRVFEKEREGRPNLVFIYDGDANPYEIIEEKPAKD